MNTRSILTGLLVVLLALSVAQAASVSWIDGDTGPKQWSIDPGNPGTYDVITFSGPTKVYSNACKGERDLGGTPRLLIDPGSKVVLLWFEGPVPGFCTEDYTPVAGLQGEFGPLETGDWTFLSLSKNVDFEIRFTVADQAVQYVDADAPGPAHNGKGWDTAFLTLQDALAAATAGDEILVAEGLYKPDEGADARRGDREASFELKDDLAVRGGFAGYGQPDPDARDVALYETVLSGDLNDNDVWGILNRDDNSYHVVVGPAGNPGAVLDGFTITAGQADGPYPHDNGGGLYNPGGDMQILRCTFQGNTAAFGGGIFNRSAPITIVNSQVIGNRAFVFGGGLHNHDGEATLHNVRVVGNTADYAETAGGAAIYNLNGTLVIADSTVADNLSPSGRAIAEFSWTRAALPTVKVTNSILYNGGDELGARDLGAISVSYSNVQGGWPGTGNIDVDPLFAGPGARSTEGEWIDGDYRLQAISLCIDAGSDSLLPPDILDLDQDGNTTEPLPVDLDDEPRVEGLQVDMGAYEQLAKKPGPEPGPDVSLTACVLGRCFTLDPDPSAPSSSYTFIGKTGLEAELNFTARLSATVTGTSPAGGTWTAWIDPDIVSPSSPTTTLWVKGENLDLGALPAGSKDVQVAQVYLYAVPVP